MEQRGHDCLAVEIPAGADFRDGNRVRDVGLAALAILAEVGFVALSQVATQTGGSRWIVPANLHQPIDQQAVLLKTGARKPAARAFLQFLKGPEAKAIIRRYGYEVR